MNKSNGTIAGVSLCDLILVAFIILKLTGVITWSWWWVLAPLWIPIIIFIVVVLLMVRLST